MLSDFLVFYKAKVIIVMNKLNAQKKGSILLAGLLTSTSSSFNEETVLLCKLFWDKGKSMCKKNEGERIPQITHKPQKYLWLMYKSRSQNTTRKKYR